MHPQHPQRCKHEKHFLVSHHTPTSVTWKISKRFLQCLRSCWSRLPAAAAHADDPSCRSCCCSRPSCSSRPVPATPGSPGDSPATATAERSSSVPLPSHLLVGRGCAVQAAALASPSPVPARRSQRPALSRGRFLHGWDHAPWGDPATRGSCTQGRPSHLGGTQPLPEPPRFQCQPRCARERHGCHHTSAQPHRPGTAASWMKGSSSLTSGAEQFTFISSYS